MRAGAPQMEPSGENQRWPTKGTSPGSGASTGGVMELFTEEHLDNVARDFRAEGEVRGVRAEMLIEHARELLRLKSQAGQELTVTPKVRESVVFPLVTGFD